MSQDPTEHSAWRPLRVLLRSLDDEIMKLYTERGIEGIRPRYATPLIRLAHRGPMTIRELCESLDVTHSAMSQTVNGMRRDGLVTSRPGKDARTRRIDLTERGRELVPFVEAEWRATERSIAELEAEIPYALTRVVQDLEAVLAKRSFHDRIVRNLEEP